MSNNRVVHFEIPANEPRVLTNLYRELFGSGVEYWSCETGADERRNQRHHHEKTELRSAPG